MREARFAPLLHVQGQMGELVRMKDWTRTPLGPISTWSPALVANVGTMLRSHLPYCIMWGSQHPLIYIEAYTSILGADLHPHALGRRMQDVWADLWDRVGVWMVRTYAGESFCFEDQQFFLPRPPPTNAQRTGRLEEVFITWCFIPLYEADGTIAGIYNPNVDVTAKVRAYRRMHALEGLSRKIAEAGTFADLASYTCSYLSQLEDDVPYVAAYLIEPSLPDGGSPLACG
jgi:hypothetical protein